MLSIRTRGSAMAWSRASGSAGATRSRRTAPITRSRSPSPDRTGVEPILGREGVGRVGRTQARAADRPVGLARPEPIVEVDGLMGPVERADAEMNDPDPGGRTVVGRPRHV